MIFLTVCIGLNLVAADGKYNVAKELFFEKVKLILNAAKFIFNENFASVLNS